MKDMMKCPECGNITLTRTFADEIICASCGASLGTTGVRGPTEQPDAEKKINQCPNCGSHWLESTVRTEEVVHECCMCGISWSDKIKEDAVNHPKHYANGYTVVVECNMYKRWLQGDLSDAFKYVWRAGDKDDFNQDLNKAIWYLEDAIEYGITCNLKQFIPFLPNEFTIGWKYNALRCILSGELEIARDIIAEQLTATYTLRSVDQSR